MKKPNIILITVDSLRQDYYGLETLDCPFQKKLLKKSVYFPNCFSLAHNTDTSFAQLLSSTHLNLIPRDTGKRKNQIDFNRYRITRPRISIAETLKNNGYNTYGFQTVPKLSPYFGYDKGFDYYRYFNPFRRGVIPGITHLYKSPSICAKDLTNIILEKEFREPYFLWIHYNDVHEPYSSSSFQLPISYLLWYRFLKKSLTKDSSNLKNSPINSHLIRKFRTLYQNQVLKLDDSLHNLFIDSGKFNIDDSLFILTADHGQFLGEHNQIGHGFARTHTRELYNVPLYFSYPKQESGNIDERQCTSLDIVPTICDSINVPKKKRYDGHSLLDDSWDGYHNIVWSNLLDYERQKFSVRIIDEPYFYWRDDFNFDEPKIYSNIDENLEIYEDSSLLEKYRSLEKSHIEYIRNRRMEYTSKISEDINDSKELNPDVIEALKAMGYI